jgi:hypothetical protein
MKACKPLPSRVSRRKSGQSMIESAGMMVLITFIFLTVFQMSQLFAAKEITHHAASAGARAKAVGFNDFMTWKVIKAALIPNSGRMITPEVDRIPFPDELYLQGVGASWDYATDANTTPRSTSIDVEMSRIPEFLGTVDWNQLYGILDYEDWDTVTWPSVIEVDDMIAVSVRQRYPLKMPFHRAFYADDEIDMRSRAWQGNHANIYLE